jgi:hypothetical protein
MTSKVVRMADVAERIGSMNISESERRRVLMAMIQAENLMDLAQVAFYKTRRIVDRVGQ